MKIVWMLSDGFGYLSNQLVEGFHLLSKQEDIEFLCTHKIIHHGAKLEDFEAVDFEEAADNVSDADLVLFSSDGDSRYREGDFGKLFLDKELSHKRIFIDGHDSNAYMTPPHNHLLYIKREMRYPEACSMVYSNVRSMTFGVYQFLIDSLIEQDDWDNREYDIAFVAFGGSNLMRGHCEITLRDVDDLNVFVEVDEGGQPLGMDEYQDVMRKTKIGISILGSGVDTLRFWETMAYGAVVCSNEIGRSMYVRDLPEPHRHALYFNSWSEMMGLSRLLIEDKRRWLTMRQSTNELVKRHSTINRARQLIELSAELI